MTVGFILMAAGLCFVIAGWVSDRTEASQKIANLEWHRDYGRWYREKDGSVMYTSMTIKMNDLDPGPPIDARRALLAPSAGQ